jgi:glutaredoxin
MRVAVIIHYCQERIPIGQHIRNTRCDILSADKEQNMKKVTVYSLSTCPVCRRVKEFLDGRDITYTLIEVDTLDSGEQWSMMKELARHNPGKTFPTTIIEDIVIGFQPEELATKISDVEQ